MMVEAIDRTSSNIFGGPNLQNFGVTKRLAEVTKPTLPAKLRQVHA